MRIYETMLVLDPEMSKEQVDGFTEKLKQFLGDRGAEVLRVQEWGVKTLAYEIKKKNKGYYLIFYLKGDEALVADMERNLRLMEEVLRYLTVKREEEDIAAAPPREEPEQEKEPEKEEEPEEEPAGGEESAGAVEEE
jgi:small subunit ribosomal protein S6